MNDDIFSCCQEEGISVMIMLAHTYRLCLSGPDEKRFNSPFRKIRASGCAISRFHTVLTVQTVVRCFGDMNIPVCGDIKGIIYGTQISKTNWKLCTGQYILCVYTVVKVTSISC